MTDKVKDSRRSFAKSTRVCISGLIINNATLKLKIIILQQKNSVIFRATNGLEETYDAYEKDITIASFFFREPMAFEYTR